MSPMAAAISNINNLSDFNCHLVDTLPVAACLCDAASGAIIYFNKKATTIWGRTPEAGEKFCGALRIFHPDGTTWSHDELPMAAVLRDGVVINDCEALIERPDGGRRYITANISPIFNQRGKVIGAIDVFLDISERKQAEQDSSQLLQMMHSEHERLIGFFAHSPAFMAVLRGPEHIYEKANERYLRMIERKNVVGKRMADVLPELASQGLLEKLDTVYNNGRTFVGNEIRVQLRTPAGHMSEKTLDLVYEPLFAADGNVSGVLVHGLDLTERKQMELELQKRAEELALSDRKKDEFIALLAHELRNPLAPIRNGLQVMAIAGDKPDLLVKVRDMMDRQLNHMVRLIDDLLDVSRMNRNKLYLKKTRVSLAEAMNHALEATRPALEAAGHQLSVQLPPDDLVLEADLTRLAQVFGNLLSNSIKYTEPGGRIWFGAEIDDCEAVVFVRDTGIGIPPQAMPNVFEMFAQVHSLERASTGLGIGLALVRTLVEMHGGRVTVESDGLGCGSRFSVRLPLPTGFLPQQAANNVPQSDCALGGVRILVVDDNRDACSSLAMLLEIMGNSVQVAYDGLMAIEIAEEVRPQLILMDIGMPVLNGYEATRRIRTQAWAKDVLIIALTGWGQEHDRIRSQTAGCDGHLVKPVSRTDLEALLTRIDTGATPSPN